MPHLVEVHEELSGQGLTILALSGEARGKVESYARKAELPFGVAAEHGSFDDYGVTAIPQAFLIDPEGKVAWAGHPASGKWLELARAML